MITEEERNRRLDAHDGYLRRRIRNAGERALFHAITSKEPVNITRQADDLRFVADCLIDHNGDVVNPHTRVTHFASRGIMVDLNRDELEDLTE